MTGHLLLSAVFADTAENRAGLESLTGDAGPLVDLGYTLRMGGAAFDDPVLATVGDLGVPFVFRTLPDVVLTPADDFTTSRCSRRVFEDQIDAAVREHNAWAILVTRPNGDVLLYDIHGIDEACRRPVSEVRLLAALPLT